MAVWNCVLWPRDDSQGAWRFALVFLGLLRLSLFAFEMLFSEILHYCHKCYDFILPGRVAQSVGHLTRKSGVLSSIPGLATYFRFSFRFFKKGSCQLLAKVCARSTG